MSEAINQKSDILNIIGGDFASLLVESQKAQARTALNASEAEILLKNSAAEYERMGVAAATKTKIEGDAALTAQERNIRAFEAFGAEDEILKSIRRITKSREAIRQEVDRYEFESQSSIEKDGIFGVIGSQFAKSYIKGQIKQHQEFMNLELNNVAQMNGLIQTTAQTNKLTTRGITDASIQAAADLEESSARLKANDLRLKGLAANTQGVQAVAQGSKERLDSWYAFNSTINTERQFAAMEEQRIWNRDVQFAQREQVRLEKEAKQENRLLDDLTVDYINTSLASFGMAGISGLEAKSRLQLFKSGKDSELQYHYQNGRNIKETGVSSVGRNVAESYSVLTQLKSNFPDLRKETAQFIVNAGEAFAASKEAKLTSAKDADEARAKFVQKLVNEQIMMMYSAVNAGDSGNIFNVGDIRAYIGTAGRPGLSSLTALPFVQKILLPSTQPLDDPKVILNLAAAAVAAGDVTSAEAVNGITQIYRRANLLNQEARGLRGFGIQIPNNGATYNARIGAFGATVDMTSPLAVTRHIALTLTSKLPKGRGFQGGPALKIGIPE
jgi:hypothetical protein